MSRPPLLLAVEAATAFASVALMRGDEVLGLQAARARGQHSENLLPMLDALLVEAGERLDAVEAFGVSIGPGGFTSLRIGLATIKGLAFDSDRPIAPVSTLEALALSALRSGRIGSEGVLVPALDARRGELYAAAYAAGADGDLLEPRLAEAVYTAEALARALPQGGLVVGEGAPLLAEALSALPDPLLRAEPAPGSRPDAVAVGLLAARVLARGGGVQAAALVPRYLRSAQAELAEGRKKPG